MRELFVYWRLSRHDLGAARAAMHLFQAGLEQDWPGLVARLYERTDNDDDSGGGGDGDATLMETYAREGGIAPGLQADIVTAGAQAAARWCHGARHVEVFVPVPR
jgi:Domain of unknown function (DUF4936)